MSPFDSDDLTYIVVEGSQGYLVLESPEEADDKPRYRPIGKFPTAELAHQFADQLRLMASRLPYAKPDGSIISTR